MYTCGSQLTGLFLYINELIYCPTSLAFIFKWNIITLASIFIKSSEISLYPVTASLTMTCFESIVFCLQMSILKITC